MDSELKSKLERAGYSMFTTEEESEDISLLIDVINSNELRLWHMFPAMMANIYKTNKFNFNELINLKNGPELLHFSYDVYNSGYESSDLFKELGEYLNKSNINHNYDNDKLNIERARELFKQYFRSDSKKSKEILSVVTDYQFEYALSEIFSPKQKDIVLKRFRGEKLTKTENESYSRVIKKKLIALSNSDLHNMAISLLK